MAEWANTHVPAMAERLVKRGAAGWTPEIAADLSCLRQDSEGFRQLVNALAPSQN